MLYSSAQAKNKIGGFMDNLPINSYQAQENSDISHPQSLEQSLAEIDRILHQMLLLAELSASDASLDRAALQRELKHLSAKIDRIADQMETK